MFGGSLVLFALRAPELRQKTGFTWLSRETFLLGNNLLLLVATFVVLLGTLFPLIGEAMSLKISVRSPYFNAFFVPLTLALMAILVPGMLSNWKRQDGKKLVRWLVWLAPASVLVGALLATLAGELPLVGVVSLIMVVFVWLAHAADMVSKARAFRQGLVRGLVRLRRAYYGMVLAHCGIALLVAGVTLVSFQEQERDLRMAPGDVAEVGGYQFLFASLQDVEGPNYKSKMALFPVSRDGASVHPGMAAEKRTYNASGQVMTEAAIDAGLMRDLYVALGEPLDDGAWAVRIYYKPGVRWIWLGSLIMALGGALALLDRRYRQRSGAETDDAD